MAGNYTPQPSIEFHDGATGRTLRYVYPDAPSDFSGWLIYRHADGHWVSLRKATDEDIRRLSRAVSEAHHGRLTSPPWGRRRRR